ncbi:MAG: elongation factor 1-beta [Nanoarchaeota archaeon]|nr:elongation factor 1-beta [Nanoarchaeota archaeon]
MADVVITMKIMPESPEADLDRIEKEAIAIIADFGGEVGKKEIEPIAFGLKALKLIFVADEKKGGTDAMEAKLSEISEVNSVEVVDVRRAIG